MAGLNITKVAFGCTDADVLRARLQAKAAGGAESWIDTRYRPTRHSELIGGSLFWIIKHQLVARSRILRFEEDDGGRCLIRLENALVPVRPRPRRAHQGWRYLTGEDAPADLIGEVDDLDEMPIALAGTLSALGLI